MSQEKKCSGLHCRCMNLDKLCPHMHYADCKEHNPSLSSPIVEEKAYNTYDHTHCWAYTKEYPPCGQKLKHYECCLCKKVHPEISQTLAEERERLVKEIEKLDSFTVEIGHGDCGSALMYEDVLNIIKNNK